MPTVDGAGEALWLAGAYDDAFVRTDEGWRFTRVSFAPAFRTPFDRAWIK